LSTNRQGSILNNNGSIALILDETNGGTRLSSTKYVHYGEITATLKTGRWNGVVTAFITMSDIKDEIDWEFPGANTTAGQSNYFWQGVIPPQTAGGTHSVSSDTFSNFHDYSINWTPDTLTWSIDNTVVRTLQKSDTVDASGIPHYPSTPSRIQLSIWPAGISSEPQGTVAWAGGMINWNDPDFVSAGHFYAMFEKVTVKCTEPTAIDPAANITSYIYGGSSNSTNNPTILLSNHSTMVNGAERIVAVIGSSGTVATAMVMALVMGVNALLL